MALFASSSTSAFDKLHPVVQRWVHDQGWSGLREIQAEAIHRIMDGSADVIISASTAAGKTEAAFLPALSSIADATSRGISILYVAPLKALINDQFSRLEALCERLELPLVRWHGDAPTGPKQQLIKQPHGVILITPESIEALFCRRPAAANMLFTELSFVIVDEVHAFLAGPRGIHLASLLRRMDALAPRSARRIGLSATLGDVDVAAAWLRPTAPKSVAVVRSAGSHAEIRLQVRGYIEPIQRESDADAPDTAMDAVAAHLMQTLRGTNSLVFGGSRQRVEYLADLLRTECEASGVPNEFFPHHGNLSKHLREDLEMRLKAGALPTTAVCTSTLELGIDIGSVASVAQVGAPRSIASLRQRLGRSGRRPGVPAVLRVYVIEGELSSDPSPLDELRQEAVRSIAAIRLLGQGFVETPTTAPGLGSALLHQVLSVICERGGIQAKALHTLLCGPGPFGNVPVPLFVALLRGMGAPEAALLEQAPDGTLMLGSAGERLSSGRDFYAMFDSQEEWRIVASGKSLGALPISNPVLAGNLIVFAGRRWIVLEVDDPAKTITVSPHPGGKPPRFEGGTGENVDDRLAAEMLAVYRSTDEPAWIDSSTRALLDEGRKAFSRLGLHAKSAHQHGDEVHIFTWKGSATNNLLSIILGAAGLRCWAHDIGIVVSRPDQQALVGALESLQLRGVPNLHSLAADVSALAVGKYDGLLPPPVLQSFWALSMDRVASGLVSANLELNDANADDSRSA